MQWIALNTVGALAWLAGLTYAKGASLPTGSLFSGGDHHFVIGVAAGLVGLATLLWANLRSAA